MSKLNLEKMAFETKVVHAGQEREPIYGALATPIYQTSTFCFESVEMAGDAFAGNLTGFHPIYSRVSNPTTRALELKCAEIEGGEDCVATASGLGAIGSVFTSFLKPGDHIIIDSIAYGGTDYIAEHNLADFNINVSRVLTSDLNAVKGAIRPETKIIFFETPNNPMMGITEIAAIKKLTAGTDIKVVVDGTFAPPPVQFALKHGADLVLHSITKYINGHGDVIGGVVVGSKEDIAKIRANSVSKLNGCPPAPFNSYLVLRGMKSLAVRMKQHCSSALEIAQYLENNPYVKKVYYPGLKSSADYKLAIKQMENNLFGAIVSFELKDNVKGFNSFEAGKKLVNHLQIPAIAVSLGDPDSLVEHPASMTHGKVAPEIRRQFGITDGLIRYSVGLENAKDLINDLEHGFAMI